MLKRIFLKDIEMLYEDKTKLIRKGLFDVQNLVGVGRREEAYHQAFRMWLDDQAIPFATKPPHPLTIQGELAYTLVPDFVLWGMITVELKAVARKLRAEERVQLFDYLKYRGDKVGLLVNMGLDRVYVERIVHEPVTSEIEEKWECWPGGIVGEDRCVGMAVRQALLSIYEEHGVGFGGEVTNKLIEFAFRQCGLHLISHPICDAMYGARKVDRAPLDCMVVENRILVVSTALFDTNDFNISRGLSYLRALELQWGIAVNFGKSTLTINGLHAA